MPKKKDDLIGYEDLDRAMKKMVKEIVAELERIVASKADINEFTDLVVTRLDSIDRHFIELKAEMRNLRIMYEFWAERHLSPELMDEFLKEQEKKRKPEIKRMD